MRPEDIYFKKVVPLELLGKTLYFRVSQDLFSSFQVDVGTRFLLRTLALNEFGSYRKVLDLGCGYGPLGLTLLKLGLVQSAHLVDRDALALAYAQQNSELNGLTQGVKVYGSLGYDDVTDRDFDLIVSNIPAKAGEAVIAHLLLDAQDYLCAGGVMAIVVVIALATWVEQLLSASPGIEVLFRRDRPGHTVFCYRFSPKCSSKSTLGATAFERGVYRLADSRQQCGDQSFLLEVAHGLAEYNGPSYATQLLCRGLTEVAGGYARTMVFNPGQGSVAVAIWLQYQPESLVLVDRDLLALRQSHRNLLRNGCPSRCIAMRHVVGFAQSAGGQSDLIIGLLRDEEGPDALAETVTRAGNLLAPGGVLILGGTSTVITRAENLLRGLRFLNVRSRRRWKGSSLLFAEQSMGMVN